MSQFTPLDVINLPLSGRHLIEASAGTGKTFNITRLYLRLLLEKGLTVQQILVMTFTKAATEEIRGRIAQTLRDAIAAWDGLMRGVSDNVDPIYCSLFERVPSEEGKLRLQAALLELDEAAVFTIHGFCNKVLSQLAFDSGTAMQLALATDTQTLYIQAAQDYIRSQQNNDDAFRALAAEGWHDPEVYLSRFGAAIRGDLVPQVLTISDIEAECEHQFADLQSQFSVQFSEVRDALLTAEATILDTLVNGKKDSDVRMQEWEQILLWLSSGSLTTPPDELGKFTNGNRYRGNDTLKALFTPLKDLAQDVKKRLSDLAAEREGQLASLPAFEAAARGIAFVREHVKAQKARQGVVDFDDLIRLLACQVTARDSDLAEVLRGLYPVALIDEFQDTDQHQYSILEAVYPSRHDNSVLMMIGDPKQAIYGFRGGDIFTYLKAGEQADYRWVMDTNWRSVAPMVQAYNRLFYGAPLDGPERAVFGYDIAYAPVKSTDKAKAAQQPLVDVQGDRRAMNYVCLDVEEDTPGKQQMQRQLSQWMCEEIIRLMAQATLGGRAVKASDIAILVRSTTEARIVQQQLRQAGLGAVFLSNKQSLFDSPQAHDVYRVLDGIWHWDNQSRLAAALSSPLLGYQHGELVALLHHEDDSIWEALIEQVQQLRQMWQQRGVMSVLLMLLQQRYLAQEDNPERALTNYLHLAEVLEHAAVAQAQPEQLLIWLHRQLVQPELTDEHVQRLESDATLIQLITQHGSKGLEYPIVFIPFGSDYRDPAKVGTAWVQEFQYYDSDSGQQVLQLGRSYKAVQRVREEGSAEATRLLYVAITRAAHRCYVGVAPFAQHEQSPLARALGVENDWRDTLSALAKESGEHSGIIVVDDSHAGHLTKLEPPPQTELAVAEFSGNVEEAWRLFSFSALTRQQTVVKQTRREAELVTDAETPDLIAVSDTKAFRFTFEKGASAGNLLHDVLEVTDFSAPDWSGQATLVAHRHGLDASRHSALFDWLQEILQTPLGGGVEGDVSLSSLSLANTLREAEFYFPLNQVRWSALAGLLQQHRQQVARGKASHPVPGLQRAVLEGMMHGFIDLIFESDGRYYVADYKSTYLGVQFDNYNYTALADNNQHHLYDLQYLIYALALHRYLRQSLPDYEPDVHFGGVYYLYLRGMHPQNAHSEGVFYTPLSASFLQALDQAFGETTDAGVMS